VDRRTFACCAALFVLPAACGGEPVGVQPVENAPTAPAYQTVAPEATRSVTPKPKATPRAKATARPKATPKPASGGFYNPPGWDGVSDVNCSDFDTHTHAQSFFKGTGGNAANDPYRLDRDHDGIACESLP
jgi:Excalibur calcium-binding domain